MIELIEVNLEMRLQDRSGGFREGKAALHISLSRPPAACQAPSTPWVLRQTCGEGADPTGKGVEVAESLVWAAAAAEAAAGSSKVLPRMPGPGRMGV